jgi:deoxyuridine 5'-triphosphate nucleotidohydrolase
MENHYQQPLYNLPPPTNSQPHFRIKRSLPGAIIPSKQTPLAAGYDLYARELFSIMGKSFKILDTGISIEMHSGFYGRIASRSSLSKKGIEVGAGVIDPDYRGTIKVLLRNLTNLKVEFPYREPIAQLIFERNAQPTLIETHEELQDSPRGSRGLTADIPPACQLL